MSKSECCGAEVSIWSGGEGTSHWDCNRCGQPCEPAEEPSFFDKEASEARAANIQPASTKPRKWWPPMRLYYTNLGALSACGQSAIYAEAREGFQQTVVDLQEVVDGPLRHIGKLKAEIAQREEAAAREAWANGWHYGFVSRDLPVGAEQMKFEAWWKRRRAGK